jgi:hypothetical protein
MSTLRTRHLLVLVATTALVAFALAVLLGACGSSDPYSGTWTFSMAGESTSVKIEKSGDKWIFTDPSSKSGETLEGTEENGKLVLKNPDDPKQTATFERKDDTLLMSIQGVTITLTKQ